jgi:hypothetical protein
MTDLSCNPEREHPEDEDVLHELIASARVVMFCSSITDVRPLTTRLNRLAIPYRLVTLGMGYSRMRQRFHALESLTGWHQLPQIFVDHRFIGGYQEFFDHDFQALPDVARPIPAPARWLGAGGLIPFVAGAIGLWFAPTGWHAEIFGMLLLYAAIILSFIGAVHWGLALRTAEGESALWRRLGVSVVPALVAWFALMAPPFTALGVLALMFGVMYVVDRLLLSNIAPDWYRRLRALLSAGATVSLLATMLAVALSGSPMMMKYPLENGNGQGAHRERGTGADMAEPLRAPYRSVVF